VRARAVDTNAREPFSCSGTARGQAPLTAKQREIIARKAARARSSTGKPKTQARECCSYFTVVSSHSHARATRTINALIANGRCAARASRRRPAPLLRPPSKRRWNAFDASWVSTASRGGAAAAGWPRRSSRSNVRL